MTRGEVERLLMAGRMLTGWLIFAALLAALASPKNAARPQSAAPTCRVKGHPGAELTLHCGDGKKAGVVQFWHTPFGDLQTSDSSTELDPVFKLQDGSLVVPNASVLHSGLYYCLLQDTVGTTLWPYELHIGQKNQENQQNQENREYGQQSSHDAFRCRRDVGSEGRQAVSDGQFAGAVAASVLLTFVVGFTAGALSRTHVLRCLGAVTIRLRSPRQRLQQTDTAGHGSEVTMVTLPPRYHSHASDVDQVTVSSTSSPPPVKPQRSFRNKQDKEQETTAYLEGCDHKEEQEELEEQEEEQEQEEEEEQEEQEEEREFSGLYLLGEDGGSQSETEEEDGGESREKKEWRQEEEEEEESEQDGGERSEDAGSSKEKDEDDREEESEEDETGSRKKENNTTEPQAPPLSSHRSRVIRLYQYDEDAGPLDMTEGRARFHLEI
ncbi:hypothetical protein L3Q82_004807 [Scortum barcoo]|uniref:Uncharacterized protein n=1 Tax=Scortum barcoo TaxID=214431 RepID=A0ACB8VDC6_9TELE|nr:hypothetical protein L3Q82_004807 [Scortum barcoo]